MMLPPCSDIQARQMRWVKSSGPRTLRVLVFSNCSSVKSVIGAKTGLVAALFTRMSMRP